MYKVLVPSFSHYHTGGEKLFKRAVFEGAGTTEHFYFISRKYVFFYRPKPGGVHDTIPLSLKKIMAAAFLATSKPNSCS